MDAKSENQDIAIKHRAISERKSDRELVSTRTFNGPARLVFKAWTTPDLFSRWWIPKSFGMTVHACEMDVRVGGAYRLVLSHNGSEPMAFFGKYTDVVAASRLVWTNDEGEEPGPVTTVTFEESAGKTLTVLHDLYPSKEALDAAVASGSTSCVCETLDQLDALVVTLSADSV
jgi:uncharacterized protein YndB with AHSA1/START domain